MGRPLAIAHRGARGYALENTLSAFRKAAALAAEMWELDVRMTADGVCVVCHDDDLRRVAGRTIRISEISWDELASVRLSNGDGVPKLHDVVDLAAKLGCGLYVEIKAEGAGPVAWRVLEEHRFRFAVLGSYDTGWVRELRDAGCDYPLSILVRQEADPMELAQISGADIVHLCWREASDRPQDLVTPSLIDATERCGLKIVIWHEERPEVISEILRLPVLGVCSDRPEILKPYAPGGDRPIRVVCHRGANAFAPENTLEAERMCFDQRFDIVELDVRTTADGALVVIHDATVDRTTDGTGAVSDMTLAELRGLDAGGWLDRHFAGLQVPTLDEFLDAAKGRGGLYVEIKDADPAAVVAAIEEKGMLDACFFWSFNIETVRKLRALSPALKLMAVRNNYPTLAAARDDYQASIIQFDPGTDDLAEIETCRRMNVLSMILEKSDDVGALARLAELSPDYVNVDRPDLFKRIASGQPTSRSALLPAEAAADGG